MGEYIRYKGKDIKIGTCEELYYARYADLKQAIMAGLTERLEGNAQPEDYLNPAHGWRYRFPFPDEDGEEIGGYWNFGYDRGLLIPIDPALAPGIYKYLIGPEWDHYRINYTANGYMPYTVLIPCPYSTAWGDIMGVSCNVNDYGVRLTQQKQVDGHLWSVIDCYHCKAKIRLDPEGGAELIALIKAAKIQDWQEIIARIESGYELDISEEVVA